MNLPVKITKVFVLFTCCLIWGLNVVYGLGKDEDAVIKAIRKQCRQLLLSDTAYATERSFRLTDDIKYKTDAAGCFKTLAADGSWKDIPYNDQTRGSWKPSWHLYRILLLNRAYAKNNDPAYLAATHRALDFWIKNDLNCENWWHNNINVPFAYSSIILQLGDKARPAELDFLNKVIVPRIQVKGATGQNLVWQLDNEARVALIHNDYSALAKIITRMQAVITITTAEGIQPDYSFHQHGPQMQVGNYGMSFVNSLLFWMAVTANTPIAFDKTRQRLLVNYCTECLRWTIYRGAMDIPAIGRQLRYNATLKRGENLHEAFALIRSFDKNLGCNAVMDGYNDQGTSACKLAGNKSFWRSDYMVQLKRSQYQMSVKMHGPFVHRLEAINAENLKGAFINDGIALVQHSGKEYLNIEAVWNWAMLPGTTCDTTVDPGSKAAFATGNTAAFVGQVSNGNSGISAMDYSRSGIKAHKSYFFVNDMLIALGAGVTSPNKKDLITTVDQSFHKGALVKGKNNGQQWFWHDNMAYYFPDKGVKIKTQTQYRQSGWEGINTNNTADDKAVAGNVITTYIAHDHSDSYAYIIKPGVNLKQTKAALGNSVKILVNTTVLQAISAGNTLMVVFYQPESIRVGQTTISADKPCMLICQKNARGINNIRVSDPTRKERSLTINIDNTKHVIELPEGDLSGSSVKALL